MAKSTIEWVNRRIPGGGYVPGYTFNPWMGCEEVSPACDNCYAKRDATRRKVVTWGDEESGGTRRVTTPGYWNAIQAAARRDYKANPTQRPLVFVASWADVFEQWPGVMLDQKFRVIRRGVVYRGCEPYGEPPGPVPYGPPATMEDYRVQLVNVMAQTSYCYDWLVLTKRAASMAAAWPKWEDQYFRIISSLSRNDARYARVQHMVNYWQRMPNVWAGVTAENQTWTDTRLKQLLTINAVRRFVSAEPLVGETTMRGALARSQEPGSPGIHWLITGGESGANARPADPNWYRKLRDEAQASGTPFHFKQWGEWASTSTPDRLNDIEYKTGEWVSKFGRDHTGRTLDGCEWDGVPESVFQ